MFTIVMNSDKSLSRRGEAVIRQGEKLVDKIKFLVPKTYGDLDLSDFSVRLTYIDPANILRVDNLTLTDPDYKGSMLCYTVPVTSALTKFAGDIKVHLLLDKNKLHTMHSGETIIHIEATNPLYHENIIFPGDLEEGYDVGWQEGYEAGYQAGLAAGGSGNDEPDGPDKPDGPGEPDEPDEPVEPDEPDGPVIPDEPTVKKLSTPVIYLDADEEPNVEKLSTPIIYLETSDDEASAYSRVGYAVLGNTLLGNIG